MRPTGRLQTTQHTFAHTLICINLIYQIDVIICDLVKVKHQFQLVLLEICFNTFITEIPKGICTKFAQTFVSEVTVGNQ